MNITGIEKLTATVEYVNSRVIYVSPESGKEYKARYMRVTVKARDGLIILSEEMPIFDVKDFCKSFIVRKGFDKIKLVFADRDVSLMFYPLHRDVLHLYGTVPALTIINPKFMRSTR